MGVPVSIAGSKTSTAHGTGEHDWCRITEYDSGVMIFYYLMRPDSRDYVSCSWRTLDHGISENFVLPANWDLLG